MSKHQDPYLLAAEGFFHSVRDELDLAEVTVDKALNIVNSYALVSIARALQELIEFQHAKESV